MKPSVRPVSSLRKWSPGIRMVFVITVAIFCLMNVYRSTTLSDHFRSSHEYFRHESVFNHWVSRPGLTGKSLVTSKKSLGDSAKVDHLSQVRSVRVEDYPPYNVTLDDGSTHYVPLWQRRLKKHNDSKRDDDDDLIGPYYYLTELLQVRIYDGDKARWTVRELKQWLHYMFLAGVEHVYVCDHYADISERLDAALQRYISAGLVTYMPWADAGRDPMTAQIRCYQRLVSRFQHRHRWQIAVDMDEYPFSPNDTEENFLVRYLDSIPDDISEILLPNYLMLGQGDRRHTKTVIERIVRMTPLAANDLVKPVYRPERLRGANVHHNHIASGRHLHPNPDQLRMLHYWGARGQNWGPDTPKILATTIPMTAMRNAWSRQLENSLIVFDERDAFSNNTGP